MHTRPRLSAMYSDAELSALARPRWDVSHWVAWVERGRDAPERRARHAEAPGRLQEDVARIVTRRRELARADHQVQLPGPGGADGDTQAVDNPGGQRAVPQHPQPPPGALLLPGEAATQTPVVAGPPAPATRNP